MGTAFFFFTWRVLCRVTLTGPKHIVNHDLVQATINNTNTPLMDPR